MNLPRPSVGVAVIIRREGRVLLGKRRNAHGEGSWGFPGGHLEFGVTLEACASRELLEETGMTASRYAVGTFTNDIFLKEGKHYITIFMVADTSAGEPEIREPERCEQWAWHAWNDLPQPLFKPIENLLKNNFDPFAL